LNKFLSSRYTKKEWKRAYEKQYDVKVSRLNAKKNQRLAVFAESTDKSYAPEQCTRY
jgi:ribosomal protein L23